VVRYFSEIWLRVSPFLILWRTQLMRLLGGDFSNLELELFGLAAGQ